MARSMTIERAAEEMAVSQDTVRTLLERGELRGHRVGRVIRVYEESVEDYQGRNEYKPKVTLKTPRPKAASRRHKAAMEALRKVGAA